MFDRDDLEGMSHTQLVEFLGNLTIPQLREWWTLSDLYFIRDLFFQGYDPTDPIQEAMYHVIEYAIEQETDGWNAGWKGDTE